VQRDVEAFATDASHPYFDEVADDIAVMIQGGHDLESAYEKAVWANPVTRQKELARLQTEQQASIREKAMKEAETARKAASLNVRTRDTSRTPTGPKGTMRNLDSVLEETMREMKSRTH
jgi:vacuolar-type H+-ATPase catalytic subunit A/Vma1